MKIQNMTKSSNEWYATQSFVTSSINNSMKSKALTLSTLGLIDNTDDSSIIIYDSINNNASLSFTLGQLSGLNNDVISTFELFINTSVAVTTINIPSSIQQINIPTELSLIDNATTTYVFTIRVIPANLIGNDSKIVQMSYAYKFKK